TAVGPGGPDDDLLLLARHHDPAGRPGLKCGDAGVILARFGGAVLQPEPDEVVAGRADLPALAAAVLHDAGRLGQQDAALGVGQDDAAALGALDDLAVVELRIEAEQAEPEAAAAVLRPVTRPLVAAHLGEHRHHLAGEAHRQLGVGAPHLDR